MLSQVMSSGKDLYDSHYNKFRFDGELDANIKRHYAVIFGDRFVIAYPLGTEDGTGDVTLEPYNAILERVKVYRLQGEVKLSLDMTSHKHYYYDISEENRCLIDDKFQGGDDTWRYYFYIFISFSKKDV